ncbi:MAG: PAS domain-containing protein [Verrucomicrobiaceae bacterium]|nr:PAS domain-containing protein [Verrucomicrobiaceae bacterium]
MSRSSSVLSSVIHARPPALPKVPRNMKPKESISDLEDMELITTALVENAPVAMAMFDRQMRYVLANRQWISDFNLRESLPLVGRSQFEVFPNLSDAWKNVYERALQGHVVRSEHDVLQGPGASPMVFRWEVRPWRKTQDASVMGIMVTCEKFLAVLPARRDGHHSPSADTAAVTDYALPVLTLDATGRVLNANQAFTDLIGIAGPEVSLAERLFPSISIPDKYVVDNHVTEALARVLSGGPAEVLFAERTTGAGEQFAWTLSACASRDSSAAAVLIGTPVAPLSAAHAAMPEPVSSASNSGALDQAGEKVQLLEAQMAQITQELTALRELEKAYRRREERHRELFDTMPGGVVVLDERGRPIFQNAHVKKLVGRELSTGASVEHWLAECCEDLSVRDEVTRVWREDVWRRQLTRIISLNTADGFIKDLEFRPTPLPQGGLLLTIHDVSESCHLEEQLHAVEAKFRSLLRDCPLPLFLTDAAGSIIDANPQAETITGKSRNELRRCSIESFLTEESNQARRTALQKAVSSGLTQTRIDAEVPTALEGIVSSTITIGIIPGANGRPHALVHFVARNHLDDQRSPAGTIEASTTAPAGETSTALLLKTDSLGRISYWNEEVGQALMGYASADIVEHWLHQLFRPSDATGFYAELQGLIESGNGEDISLKWAWYGAGGRRGEADFVIEPLSDGPCAVSLKVRHHHLSNGTDEKPRGRAASYIIAPGPAHLWQSVGDLDREKLLLSETHHRVKNHFQILSSLLNLQSNEVEEETRQILRSTQNRIRAVAALQQHLFDLQMGQSAGLQEFAVELTQRLRECYEVSDDRVVVEVDLTGVKIRPEWFVPLALILNEAVSNVFKHAYPDSRSGRVKMSLCCEEDGAHLRVRDNGVGLPAHFGSPGSTGMGLKVLGIFADQLHGKVSLKNIEDGGVLFDLLFPMRCVDI